MAEVLISFERPPSMSRPEMTGWITGRAEACSPAITLRVTDLAEEDPQVLRVEARDWTQAAQDELADLMMEMRLLGLRPRMMSVPR